MVELQADLIRRIVMEPPKRGPLLQEVDRPSRGADELLVRTLLTGIDGTDEEIVQGHYGEPPKGEQFLTLGHEALGEVVEAPPGSDLQPGDRVVPLVRHGCGMCRSCQYDAPDMCPNQEYAEHGIKGLDGFMREYWTDNPGSLVRTPRNLGELAVLTEPLSIVVKTVEAARHIQRRIPWFEPEGEFRGQRALIAGTGSLGSLAAFLLRSEGMDVWSMDRHGDDTYVARLLRDIGVRHLNAKEEDVQALARDVGGFDLVVEATGVPQVVFRTLLTLNENGLMAMLGVPSERPPIQVEGVDIMKQMVVGNQVMVGSVNSNRGHFQLAMQALQAFRERWGDKIDGVLTHRYRPEDYERAFREDTPDMVKKVMEWNGGRRA